MIERLPRTMVVMDNVSMDEKVQDYGTMAKFIQGVGAWEFKSAHELEFSPSRDDLSILLGHYWSGIEEHRHHVGTTHSEAQSKELHFMAQALWYLAV